AATMLQGMTAHCLAYDVYQLKPGDKAVVHAGAGGTGLLLIQMVKRLGAHVFATVSSEAKAAIARGVGADQVIIYTEEDFEQAVMKATAGEGVQVVYDAVGRTTFEKGFRCLAPRGCLVLYGQASGQVTWLDTRAMSRGSYSFIRPLLNHYTQSRAALLHKANDVLNWVQSGELAIRVHASIPLSEAKEAHRELEGRLSSGKILLIP
ncbi:zinc-binding dehydrogenase, partial [Dehalococcoidia bacterium]|nr:zinc-binding dehydrogenase [Dehalococcoidia bacterium]